MVPLAEGAGFKYHLQLHTFRATQRSRFSQLSFFSFFVNRYCCTLEFPFFLQTCATGARKLEKSCLIRPGHGFEHSVAHVAWCFH